MSLTGVPVSSGWPSASCQETRAGMVDESFSPSYPSRHMPALLNRLSAPHTPVLACDDTARGRFDEALEFLGRVTHRHLHEDDGSLAGWHARLVDTLPPLGRPDARIFSMGALRYGVMVQQQDE